MLGQLASPDGDGAGRPFTELALSGELRSVQGTAQTSKDRHECILESRLTGPHVLQSNAGICQSGPHAGLACPSILDHEIETIPKSLDVLDLGSVDEQVLGAAEVVRMDFESGESQTVANLRRSSGLMDQTFI